MYNGRIARFDAPNQPFTVERVHLDEVRRGEILIRVKRANICGSDLHAWHGDFSTRGLGGKLPTVLGHEMVGTIEELGDGVTTDASGKPLAKGTRVVFPYFTSCGSCQSCLSGRRVGCPKMTMAMLGSAAERPYFVGGYGDFYLLPVGSVVYTVSDFVSDDLAAGANCALSQVMHGLERIDQGFGDDVVVQGAGGLGLYAVAVAKARGARQVIAVDGVRDRLELATAFGADHVINLTELTEVKQRVKRVRELTDGKGGDVVVEVVGHPSAIDEGLKMLAQYGRYVEMGNINMESTVQFAPARFLFSNKTIVGVSMYEPIVLSRALTFLEKYQHTLPLDRLAAATYSLEDINSAFAAADGRRDVRASIVP